jgi:hypothetical protein
VGDRRSPGPGDDRWAHHHRRERPHLRRGDTIGTALGTAASGGTAVINVFATLICENTAPFTDRNTNLKGVPLAANGDFKIDDVLSPPPPAPSACATPVLLIRNAGNQNYFAAGIQNFGTQDNQ